MYHVCAHTCDYVFSVCMRLCMHICAYKCMCALMFLSVCVCVGGGGGGVCVCVRWHSYQSLPSKIYLQLCIYFACIRTPSKKQITYMSRAPNFHLLTQKQAFSLFRILMYLPFPPFFSKTNLNYNLSVKKF